MPKRINRKILQDEIKQRIRDSYLYFLGFYLFSLFLSLFSKIWSGFFYWPAFHWAIFFYTLLFILSFEVKINFKRIFKTPYINFKSNFKIRDLYIQRRLEFIGLTQNSFRLVMIQIKKYAQYIYKRLSSLSLHTWLKIFIIAVVLIFAIYYEIEVIDFLILLYALMSILFILDSRYAAGAALVFLISCPFLIIFKEDAVAELSAIYAYYFLIITVIIQIRELKKEGNNNKIS